MMRSSLAALAASAMLVAAPAAAQKSADTLRFAILEPISTADYTQDFKPEAQLVSRAVFDTLVAFDKAAREFKPVLAESWRWADDKTLEFKLKRGVKFHDGSDFTAEDVVYTITYLADPASKLRFTDLAWIDKVEKVDDYTVRFSLKQPTASALARLAASAPIFPAAVLSKYADKSEFGRKTPIGTGPYKIEYINAGKDTMLVRNDACGHCAPWRPAGTIKRINIQTIPDLQTQIAQAMTGGVDMMRAVPKDEAEQLATHPGLMVSYNVGTTLYFMSIDAINRSGNAALSKPAVRKALMMAVDRDTLAKNVISGGQYVKPLDAVCTEIQVGCAVSSKPPGFDPAAAKKLLAEAGYPDGFELDITSYISSRQAAEAIAGQFRKIGVRAKVDARTMAGFRDKQINGKIEVLVARWDALGAVDVSLTLDNYFSLSPRDYWRDQTIVDWSREAAQEMNPEKRRALYGRIFDRINGEHYFLPLTTDPTVLVHSKEVTFEPGTVGAEGADLNRIRWK